MLSDASPIVSAVHDDWTDEQHYAIDRREGDLFLDAAAGSGKTSVLVERFARAVLEDAVDVGRILTITFTDKAAAEMRERIRARLRDLGAAEQARATEGAFISTIHAFCARVLRAYALNAGVDPAFVVLDQPLAARVARRAFDEALEHLARTAAGAEELIASYGIYDLRASTLAAYGQLRSRGQLQPSLPHPGPAPDLTPLFEQARVRAERALRELGTVTDPSSRVLEAIERLERAAVLAPKAPPWPGDLGALRVPGGNGAALSTQACLDYTDALRALRDASAHHLALGVRDLFDELLRGFGNRYERRKRELSGLDFEDLELLCHDLLSSHPEIRDRYRQRFERVMVDELQDTNAVQMELIELVANGNLFTVGDAQQSIYGFRHADVSLFEGRGTRLAGAGARATLQMNFRSRPEILDVVNRSFAPLLGDRFTPLRPGRPGTGAAEPLVELLLVDRGGESEGDERPLSWRLAEAELLAARVQGLTENGARFGDFVILTRATTDMRVYEQALERRGIPTYVIGGRGYWTHPQVVDTLAYLRLLANPRDEDAVYTVLVSPFVGASYDSLVLIGAAARERGSDPWRVLQEAAAGEGELPAGLAAEDGARILTFVRWAQAERRSSARMGVQELIERALEHTGYDLAVLALPGGQRRLANVRKLMRLGREHDAGAGPDLRGFLDLAAERASPGGPAGEVESEAPVESEALDAVRLMTIHRAKGLEFPIVCVADLGRAPRWGGEVLRVSASADPAHPGGRIGLRLARPGTGGREAALEFEALGEEQRAAESAEERRLFYVAATRARERLIFSGAADIEAVWGGRHGAAPIGWLGPALAPELPGESRQGVLDGVRVVIATPGEVLAHTPGVTPPPARAPLVVPASAGPPPLVPVPAPPSLSYTALAQYGRCAYRFYAERVLRLPPRPLPAPDPGGGSGAGSSGRGGPAGLSATERGTVIHALLERLDFRRPATPGTAAITAAAGRPLAESEAQEIAGLIGAFAAGALCARLARATSTYREQPFGFLLDETMVTGVFDVLAYEEGGRGLIVDYKSDRLEGMAPEELVASSYSTQRLIYALAALRDRAEAVEVVHVFLERPEIPVVAEFVRGDAPELEQRLRGLVERVGRGLFPVSDQPHRGLCSGCPAEGGLCSWPLALTRRDAPDRLF